MSSSFLSRASVVSVAQSCPTLGDPMDCSPPGFIAWCLHGVALLCSRPVGEGQETCAQQALCFFLVGARSSVHGILQASILEWTATPSSRGSSRPRDGTQVSRGASRFALLQGILPTQGWNPGLPWDQQILYQLSPQGAAQAPAEGSAAAPGHWSQCSRGLIHCCEVLFGCTVLDHGSSAYLITYLKPV